MELQQFHVIETRCTQEDMPRCTAACPIHVDVRGMLAAARKGEYSKAYALFAQTVPFPGIISRICDHPCEQACLRTEIDEGVHINALEQACATFNRRAIPKRPLIPQKPKKVAIVGAGLSGLTAAYHLAAKGYRVTVFEASTSLGGRIQAFSEETLPAQVIETDFAELTRLRVEFQLGESVGNHASATQRFSQLVQDFDALYIALGQGDLAELALGLVCDDDGALQLDPVTLGTSDPKVFAGGALRRKEACPSFIASVSDGKTAMISIDRFLQGVSLTSERANEGPQPTQLHTNIEGVSPQAAIIASEAQGYTNSEAKAEAGRCLECQCLQCFNLCEYMKHYKSNPKQLARQVFKNMSGVGGHRFNEQMNSCSLCRQCEAVCPDGFSMADICHAARIALVNNGKMPPSAFDFALADTRYSATDAFTLVKHAPQTQTSQYAFYPGCQLAGSNPQQVQEVYQYLREHLDGGVGMLLSCCGVQADWAGDTALFTQSLARVREQWEALGKPILITACPTCHMVFKQHCPDIPTEFIVPLLERIGVPSVAASLPQKVSIHDSCTTRYERELQDSVRRVLTTLGVEIVELAENRERTQCCGFGGLMQISNRDLAHKVVDRRIQESEADYLVYCSMCRNNFSQAGKTTFHILDLLFGDGKAYPAAGYSLRHDNRALLKKQLVQSLWPDGQEDTGPRFTLQVSAEVREVMEASLILDADVLAVIEYAQTSGNQLMNTTNGHFVASYKPNHVTYWVEYSLEGTVATIYDAYCHRLEIMGLAASASTCSLSFKK